MAVIRLDGDEFSGDAAPALAELDRSGTVHIIDLAFLRKEPDESVSCLEISDEGVAGAFRVSPTASSTCSTTRTWT